MTSLFFGGRPAVAPARTRLRATSWLFGVCLLVLSGLAHAIGCPPQSITVASGGSVKTDLTSCSATGIGGYQSPPQHGLNQNSDNNNSTSQVFYTNNGDGSTTDSFSVIDSDDNSVIPFTVTVQQTSPSVTTTTLPDATVGTGYNQSLAASGGSTPYTWSLTGGSLPNGLTLSSAGVVTGTPTQAGSFNPVFTVTDSGNRTASRAIAFSVSAPTLAITPATLPNPVIGTAYSQTLGTSGGTAPYTYSISGGTLPPGISVSSTGNVSGNATTPGNYSFTVSSTDSSTGSGAPFSTTRTYAVTVSAPTITVAPATLPNPTVGVAYSQTISASGGTAPYTFAITAGALPAGMTLAGGGALSGTPTAAGTFNFTVTATDNGGFTGSNAYTITVAAPTIAIAPANLPNAVAGQAYSSTVTASGGTAPYAFAVTGGTLPSGITLSSTGVLSGTSTVAGTFNFTVSATDSSSGAGAPFSGSHAYSLTVGAPSVTVAPATLPNPTVGAAYSQNVSASGGTAPYTFAVTAGATPSGLSLSAAGVLSGTPTAAGTFNFTVTATDDNGFDGAHAYTVTVGGPTLVLTPTSQPTGHVGQAYTTSYSTTGGTAPYHYTVTGSLPTGLSLADNGTLSGTPTQAGNFPVAIHVTDSSTGAGSPFTATVNMTLAVDADPLVLTPASPALTATYGVSNSITFTSSGGSAPRTLSLAGALPAGMSFDPASGVLSGTPTVTGSFPFTVTVTDGSLTPATLSRNYTLTIAAVTVVVSPATLPGGVVGTAYSGSLSASGGAAPYTFAVSTGALPEGIALSPAGALSGTPTRSGAVSFTVRAADAHGMAGTQAYSVTIGDAVPVAVADTASTAANQAVTIPVTANDTGVITSVAVAAAPTHGTAVADGTSVRYTPATDFFGTDTFTYTAVGPGGRSNAATVTVNVQAGALPIVPDQAVTGVAGQAINVNAIQGASGGPFTAVTLVTPPAAGTATVNGTTIAYTAPADTSGTQRFTYTLTNVFGVSQPATVTVTVQPRPVAVALTATVGAGQSVQVDLTGAARGGPFTDAAVVSLSPAQSGTATIVKTAAGYRLDFAAAAAFSGQAQLVYTLSNAYAVSQPATVTITVTARPDPSRDPEVTGILGAQVDATRRMATGQISNFQQRLESLHGAASSRFSNGLSFSSGGGRNAVQSERPGKGVAESMNDPDAPAFLQSDARPAPTQSGGQASPDDVSFWTGGAVNFGATDRGAASNGVDFTTSGVSVGADKRLSNALTLGLGVGYGHDASDIGKMGSRSTTTAYNMALYASLRPSDSTYVDTLLGYQWLDFDARRYVTADGGRVTGSRNGRQAFASVAFGYEHDDGTTRLTPYGRLDVARAQLDGYTERGDATYALDYRGQTVRTSTGALGLRAEFRLKRDFGTLVPRVRVEYQRDFQGASNAKMSYADLLAGPLYRANVGDTARNHTLLGLGVQAQFDSGLTLRAEYQALFDSGTHANQSILLGIEKAF
ncbi:putative Ig domain-containing protein [Dyella sp. 333MFSha]|uniref:putative Ig domain-containing protein n=1 Tax=Dyella sp. 333MFSha TaxID=1798240 RepID=UPI00088842D3|nr:putative Ig domain-containing protein [Dyella sp. 333MFSha]SDG49301.1 outer membrane autotransporter barrel domain-containing protein [Dyella sp. 333MFSha]